MLCNIEYVFKSLHFYAFDFMQLVNIICFERCDQIPDQLMISDDIFISSFKKVVLRNVMHIILKS